MMAISTTAVNQHNRLMFSKKAFAAVSLFFVLLAPVFLPPEVISAFLFFCVMFILFVSGLKFPRKLLNLIFPMLLFILLGIMGSSGNSPYEAFKDVWYVGKSILALMAGYMLMAGVKDIRSLLRIFLIVAALSALAHLSKFALDPSLLTESLKDIRDDAGKGFFISVLSIAVIAACWRFKLKIFKRKEILIAVFALSFISLTLSFSRTFWISLAVMLFSIFGFLTLSNLKKMFMLFILAVISIVFVMTAPVQDQTGPNATLRGKMAYSLKETMIKNYENKLDINQNWRGYESFRALTTYMSGSGTQYVIGKGFGTLVDLGLYIKLGGDEKFRFIPTLHNGYMYVLVKTGIVGILIYLYFLLRILFYGRSSEKSPDEYSRFAGKFIVALTMVLFLTTLVIAGFFTKITMHPVLVLLGALVWYINNNHARGAEKAYNL